MIAAEPLARPRCADLHASARVVVANADADTVPEPPVGYHRDVGQCADCCRGISWMAGPGLNPRRLVGLVLICGHCARDRERARLSS